ncbi:MAG: tRNA (adenine-N1)-methyltransferase [Nitrososphaerota archaeon]|jgi:tRNA (adenine57-N1/adenine58-N1)-methyltransferase|nr:tRNA (adenine-N1)-methyltransferase [Nitrososphaerota archaeon]MDG6930235.1 tRNA (adenine-N1)-methyltransferase [Nitrososphaerota archaeon]MDG6932641.1 tRNA (adenine-N1)-methyltransferase [Nitrososphaerota archaeon]MDG6935567.1 tRNA (adenine-N1)-methyltransferase [Nitrososphaerota archaeon]MDG6944011.1 tRNA (adenine-N1)-methyltransferase [Nitrososphaerota archaeon]
MDGISYGDHVLIVYGGRTWLVKVESGKKFQTHLSTIDLDRIVGLPYGSRVNFGVEYLFLKPMLEDIIMKYRRLTQIIYPKDAGYILVKLNITPGMKVLEMGTGSGALTSYIANTLRPDGRVVSYDINEKFVKIAMENVKKARLENWIEFRNFDGSLPEAEFDSAFIDLGDPWLYAEKIWGSLKPSAPVGFLLPTVDQLEKLDRALKETGFWIDETVEILLRRMVVAEGRTRPSGLMVGHTAYLTFARRSERKNANIAAEADNAHVM